MSSEWPNRRRMPRHEVHVPINVVNVGVGTTANVSGTGIAFRIDAPLEPGSPIHFEFTLPRNGLVIFGEGRIVRVEPAGEEILAAATIDTLEPALAPAPTGRGGTA